MTATAELPAAHRGSRGQGQFSRELGEWLRITRRRLGLSLLDVEQQSGGRFKTATLRSWETAAREMPVEKLASLAEFYGVPVTALLPGT